MLSRSGFVYETPGPVGWEDAATGNSSGSATTPAGNAGSETAQVNRCSRVYGPGLVWFALFGHVCTERTPLLQKEGVSAHISIQKIGSHLQAKIYI